LGTGCDGSNDDDDDDAVDVVNDNGVIDGDDDDSPGFALDNRNNDDSDFDFDDVDDMVWSFLLDDDVSAEILNFSVKFGIISKLSQKYSNF